MHFESTHWSGPKTIRECFDHVPDYLEQYIPDFQIRVVEVTFLSDFAIVADYFRQMRLTGTYNPPTTVVQHVDEMLKMLEAFAKDQNSKIVLRKSMKTFEEEKEVPMTSSIDKMLEKNATEAKMMALAEAVKGLMETSHNSFDGAAEAMKIPPEQRPAIQKYLGL